MPSTEVKVSVTETPEKVWLTAADPIKDITVALQNAMPRSPKPSPLAPYSADHLFPSIALPPYYMPSWWYRTPTPDLPTIRQVIFNDPATVVIWGDRTKTVVKCQPGDTFSKEMGLAMAIVKKVYGNKGNYNDVFRKWVPRNE